MKKNILSLVLIIGIAMPMFFSSCQRDDICSENPTTPKLILRFYDFINQDEVSSVTQLRVYEPETSNGDSVMLIDRVNTDSIAIPLRAFANSMELVFITNSGGDAGNETGNIDTLTFNYTVNERFLSRGCGVVANFTIIDIDRIADGDEWIIDTEIVNPTVENENEAHVKIFRN